jgi:signal transduction histidine kinase
MRLSIATKIFIAFAGVIITFAAVTMTGIYRTQSSYDQLEALNRRVLPLTLTLSDAHNDIKTLSAALGDSDLDALPQSLRILQTTSLGVGGLSSKIERAAELARAAASGDALAPPERARLADVSRRLDDFAALATQLDAPARALTRSLDPNAPVVDPAELDLQRVALRETTRELDATLGRLRNDLRISTDLALVRAGDAQRSNLYALVASSVIGLLIALALLATALFTVRPLRSLTDGVKRIARGDYAPIDSSDRAAAAQDEIGMLAREFNSMAEALDARDRALRAQHDELLRSERLATVGRMTSLITHELRNPLSSVGLNAEIVIDALGDPELDRAEMRSHLEVISGEVDRLKEITEEYLVYARLPSPKPQRFCLSDALDALVDFHSWEWGGRGVEVALALPDDPFDVTADPNQIRQALLNLLKNAVEASERGDAVDVSLEPHPDHALIRIVDHGHGVPEAMIATLFDPFVTSKSNGTGLGLAMTHEILREHGGAVAHEHTPGGGATFVVTLPTTPPELTTET